MVSAAVIDQPAAMLSTAHIAGDSPSPRTDERSAIPAVIDERMKASDTHGASGSRERLTSRSSASTSGITLSSISSSPVMMDRYAR